MIVLISYPLTTSSPLYPGTVPVRIVPEKTMASGNSANTSNISFSSHAGTHIDTPFHFCPEGQPVASVLRQMNRFYPAYCIDIPLKGESSVDSMDLKRKMEGMADAEAILIRTGVGHLRGPNPDAYAKCHPWIPADTAVFLRNECPRLRLVGMDFISVSTQSRREEGRQSHREFLCREKPICLLEDADLSRLAADRPVTLFVIPWLYENLDGVPVTAFVSMPDE